MNLALSFVVTLVSSLLLASSTMAQDEPEPQTLITNVNIFDGTSDSLRTGMSVLRGSASGWSGGWGTPEGRAIPRARRNLGPA